MPLCPSALSNGTSRRASKQFQTCLPSVRCLGSMTAAAPMASSPAGPDIKNTRSHRNSTSLRPRRSNTFCVAPDPRAVYRILHDVQSDA